MAAIIEDKPDAPKATAYRNQGHQLRWATLELRRHQYRSDRKAKSSIQDALNSVWIKSRGLQTRPRQVGVK